MTWVLVGLGGAIGAMARFGAVGLAGRVFGPGFPYGTMMVNVVGSFLMGIAAAVLVLRAMPGNETLLRPFLMTGILGGFTTFSAYSLDAVSLFEEGRYEAALFYVLGSVLLSIVALLAGLALARSLIS